MSFNFPPKGWALCNGALLPINQNQALFALLGTMYGGNGQTTFALPNLQGRTPVHPGGGLTQGHPAGDVNVTLSVQQMPTHTHVLEGTNDAATASSPNNALLAQSGRDVYGAAQQPVAMAAGIVSNQGGGQAHNNMQPYTVVSFAIALQGIFPSHN